MVRRLWRAVRRLAALIVAAPFLIGLTLALYAVAGTPPWRSKAARRSRDRALADQRRT